MGRKITGTWLGQSLGRAAAGHGGGQLHHRHLPPYGLDCSGFVDWAFYNATGGSYVIGHGGGATMQHSYCTDISWADAQPGDLVFYPDNSHVGIVGGRDANGELLIIHCASGHNNVVITGKEGFTSISRPRYYAE